MTEFLDAFKTVSR